MALQSILPVVHTPARPPVRLADAASDRARSFRQARRHTFMVRTLRLAFPLIGLLALSTYALGIRLSLSIKGGKFDPGKIEISTENLTMSSPKYEGFNADGSKYVVSARTATQSISQKGPIGLTDIDSKMFQSNGTTVTMTAPRGSFDNAKNELELFDDIKVRSTDGMRADLTQATVYTKANRIVSTQPVAIDMPAGQVRANEMDLRHGAKQVLFSNGVITRLKPEARKTPETVKPVAAAGAAPKLIGSGEGPVDVASQTLDVDDAKKIAIFNGDVVATQGEATLRSQQLQAFYEGNTVNAPGTAPAAPPPVANPPAAPAPPGGGKLKRLVIPNDVTLTQGTDRVTSQSGEFDVERDTAILVGRVNITSGAERRATSERGEFDQRADTALLTGNVEVQQEKNLLRGARLFVDRKAGTTKLSTPPITAGQPPGRISAHFVQAAAATAAPKPAAKTAAAVQGAAQGANGFVFRTDPNAPIDIDSETLDVLDKAKTATFRGAVHAVQGEFVIRTAELVATFTGESGLGLPTSGGSAANKQQGSTQLTRVRAPQKVEVTSADGQSATGDQGDFDVKANKVTLTGNVAVKKGSSVAYGPKVLIDMITGLTYFETVAVAGPRVGPAPSEQRAPYVLPDLPAKKEPYVTPTPPAFDTNPAACAPGRTCIRFDPKDSNKDAPPAKSDTKKGSALPWQTDTAPTPKPTKAPEASGWTSSGPTN